MCQTISNVLQTVVIQLKYMLVTANTTKNSQQRHHILGKWVVWDREPSLWLSSYRIHDPMFVRFQIPSSEVYLLLGFVRFSERVFCFFNRGDVNRRKWMEKFSWIELLNKIWYIRKVSKPILQESLVSYIALALLFNLNCKYLIYILSLRFQICISFIFSYFVLEKKRLHSLPPRKQNFN